MLEGNTLILIGEVLTRAGILSSEQLQDRLEITKTIGQPLGQTLLQLGDLSKYQLRCVVQLQSLMGDGLLDEDKAVTATKLVCQDGCSLEQAFEKIGVVSESAWRSRLGQLLLDSGVLTRRRLARGLVVATRQCSPLGHCLIQLGLLDPSILSLALSLQRDVRTGRKTRDQALSELRASSAAPD